MRFSIRTVTGDAPKSGKVEKVTSIRTEEMDEDTFNRWAGITQIRMMARTTPQDIEKAREKAERYWREWGTNPRVEGFTHKRDFVEVGYFIDIETLDDLKTLRAEEGHPIRLEDDEIIVLDEDFD